MPNQEPETRRCYLPCEELRVVETEGQPARIEGLAVPYGQLSEDLGGFREQFAPGSLTESIRSEKDKRADIEHDVRQLLGRTSKRTLRLSEDQRGVWASISVPETDLGRNAVADVKNGNRDAMSVSFSRAGVKDRFDRRQGETIRTIEKAELASVSLTAFPAYPQTAGEVTLRSLREWEEEQRKAESGEGEETPGPDIEILRKRIEIEEVLEERFVE